jgi:hypothetical protein
MGEPVVGRMSPGAWTAVAVAAPGCMLAIASALALTLAIPGRHPMWPLHTLNLSEAASVDDEAEVVRLIERGEDPDAARDVRAGLLFDSAVRLTPIEAAVASKNPSMISTLLVNGATLDERAWNRLRCLADEEDVVLMLDGHRPPDATMQCDDHDLRWQ